MIEPYVRSVVTETYAQACLKLSELIRERFGDYEPEDIILDARAVERNGRRVATALVAYPRGRADKIVGCMWPPVPELDS